MKRDIDLIRKMLLEIEKNTDDKPLKKIEIDGYKEEEIAYQVYLIQQAGFVDAYLSYVNSMTAPKSYVIYKMTWSGHDFLDACRNEGIWNKAKAKLKSVGGEVPIEVVKTLLIEVIKQQVGM